MLYHLSYWLVFFFKQKTAYEMRISDWSSDVCSSDLIARDFVDRNRDFLDFRRCRTDLLRLMLGRFGQMHRGRLRLLRRCGDLHGRLVDRLHQAAQGFDREVDRVRDRAGNFLGNRRLYRQIALGEGTRSEEHTSDLQSLMRISYAVFCLK